MDLTRSNLYVVEPLRVLYNGTYSLSRRKSIRTEIATICRSFVQTVFSVPPFLCEIRSLTTLFAPVSFLDKSLALGRYFPLPIASAVYFRRETGLSHKGIFGEDI